MKIFLPGVERVVAKNNSITNDQINRSTSNRTRTSSTRIGINFGISNRKYES